MARKTKVSQPSESLFTIEALAKSNEFAAYSDLVKALFISQDRATKSEVKAAIETYLNKEVQ